MTMLQVAAWWSTPSALPCQQPKPCRLCRLWYYLRGSVNLTMPAVVDPAHTPPQYCSVSENCRDLVVRQTAFRMSSNIGIQAIINFRVHRERVGQLSSLT